MMSGSMISVTLLGRQGAGEKLSFWKDIWTPSKQKRKIGNTTLLEGKLRMEKYTVGELLT